MDDPFYRKGDLWLPQDPWQHAAPAIIGRPHCDILGFGGMLMGSAAAAPDPYFSSVSILVQPKSTDANGTITDYSNNAASVTKHGATTTSASGAYYGSTKTVVSTGDGDNFSFNAISAYDLSGVDFTFESLIYLTNVSGNRIFQQTTGDFGNGHALYTDSGGSAGALRYVLNAAGSTIINIGSTVLVVNTWYYVAVVRSGNNFTQYINGSNVASTTSVVGPVTYTSPFTFCSASDALNNGLKGDMNFSRLTKGVARTIGNIPASPLPYN